MITGDRDLSIEAHTKGNSVANESGEPEWSVLRDENGICMGVRLHNGPIISPEVPEFLKWNSEQDQPLDTAPGVLPAGHYWFAEASQLIEHCKIEGILLFNGNRRDEPGAFQSIARAEFPGKGTLVRLQCAEPVFDMEKGMQVRLDWFAGSAVEMGPGALFGLGPAKSNLWVRETVLPELNSALQDDTSDVRKASTLPISRTFVYLDVSDFSKFPAGQQALVVNSINRIVGHDQCWDWYPAVGARQSIESRICIGDGYIFVFRFAKQAATFGCVIAYLIETLRAIPSTPLMPVDFHFRIGIHTGQVFCFWDPGRNDWNYTGVGINGGQRVLAAAGKEKDDVVFLSDHVRTAILSESHGHDMDLTILGALHNKGRSADKHGGMWRLYEANHTDFLSPQLSQSYLMSDLQNLRRNPARPDTR